MFSKVRVQAVSFSVARTVRSFSQFKKVGVVGLGLMGHGVAQVTAAAGYQVLAIEAKPEALAVGMKRLVCISWLFVTRWALFDIDLLLFQNRRFPVEGCRQKRKDRQRNTGMNCGIKYYKLNLYGVM